MTQKENLDFIEEDTLDLVVLLKPLFLKWRLLLKTLFLGMCLGFLFTFSVPKYYHTKVSFFLQGGGSPSMGGGSQIPYLNLLGGGGSTGGQFEAMFTALFESQKLKSLIAKDFQKSNQRSGKVLGNLGLHHLQLEEKKSVQVISFKHGDPELAFLVVQSALKNLEKLNENLELGSEKQVIKILDEAVKPLFSRKRHFLLYALIGGGVGVVLTSLWIFLSFLFQRHRSEL